jgi:MoxR-like ATPase
MWDALRMPTRNNLLVTGESGSGKTSFIRYLGRVYQETLFRKGLEEQDPAVAAHINSRASSFQARVLTFHENIRRSDITERRHYGESGEEKTGWTMSDVMDGMVAGDWNVLSEINRTGEDVQAEFNEPLENKAKTLHQRVIHGHPDSRFIATVNPVKGEGRGIYEGRVMSGEFMNRFTNKVHLKYLPPDQEFEVLKDYGKDVDDRIIDRLVVLANDIRRDYGEEHGVVPFPVTTRALIRMVRHLEVFPRDADMIRSLFWRKAYWLDERIHPPIARKLVEDLLDLHDIADSPRPARARSQTVQKSGKDIPCLKIGDVTHPIGPGGPYVPDTVIEEVPQNLTDLEWILKDIVLKENILLIGEAGVGKNKLESYLSHLLNWNLLVIGMSGETKVSDLLTYRSFGEEEEGKTGDTATLGLQALTDADHQWIIVLDEANKANPGVLVSFNDLLQDRLVRLPRGREAVVRAAICVNINPNRPPYEVNDFSFEFMDRFSIHTIVHLPADQAVRVLHKKYPQADVDFIRDVVSGYYTLHPLYSGGVLFEPITMRNEEAAIERGLQYPETACNLIDLICSGYSPRDIREQNAVRSTLQSRGFDRSVVSSAVGLSRFRESWDADKKNGEKALALAKTYHAIGKPSAAREILNAMLSVHPGWDWVYHLTSAGIHMDSCRTEDALRDLSAGFGRGATLCMQNREKYQVLYAELLGRENVPLISLEVLNMKTSIPGLVCTDKVVPSGSVLHRVSGDFHRVHTDREHDLAVYEMIPRGGDENGESNYYRINSPIAQEECPGTLMNVGIPTEDLVMRLIHLVWASLDIEKQVCHGILFPPGEVQYHDEKIIRDFTTGLLQVRIVAGPGPGWSVSCTHAGKPPESPPDVAAGWILNEKVSAEMVLFVEWAGERKYIPAEGDPFHSLLDDEPSGRLYLALKGDIAERVRKAFPGCPLPGNGGFVCILSPDEYHSRIVSRELTALHGRLGELFRFARPAAGYKAFGAGDVVYTVRPDSQTAISLIMDVDGMGPVLAGLGPIPGQVPGVYRGPSGDLPGEDRLSSRMLIPFSRLRECDEWRLQAVQPETQAFIRDIRRYIASVFFERSQNRDFGFEARACAVLSAAWKSARPLDSLHPGISRGDILVRADTGMPEPGQARSVFVIRFLQDNGATMDTPPLLRGFWLSEQNAVGTMHFNEVSGRFVLVTMPENDKYCRIVNNLATACSSSVRPWEFTRTGTWSDPEIRCAWNSFELVYHPVERRIRIAFRCGKNGGKFILEEIGYPAGTTVVTSDQGEELRWQGTPVIDLLHDAGRDLFVIVLEDDFYAHIITEKRWVCSLADSRGSTRLMLTSRSEAETHGNIPPAAPE